MSLVTNRQEAAAGSELDPFRRVRRCQGALRKALEEELLLEYLHIAEAAARRYEGAGRDLEDLRQVARLGLLKAVRSFDPERGTQFPAYALPTVTGELKRYLRDSCWMIRPPRRVQDLRTDLAKAAPGLAQRLGREATETELAVELGVSRQAVAEALASRNSLRPDSLEAPLEGREPAETLGGWDGRLDAVESRVMLRAALRELSGRERRLLFYRYFHEESQQRIGERLGMTQMQVSRMLAAVLVKLQGHLLEEPAGAGQPARTA
ncbi:sigma-70 family RNA polymerase sigma factor [Arthrobacter sp. GCM10027362]|uniref:sigma-70 family RNA polymerase sigma factor n=1 Tax=Arthrobacter sp. GCM10027362 TaxID=3273379 RepID=UPI00363146FB